MKYQPPFAPGWPNVPDPDASYINGNPPEGLKGSVPPGEAIEYPQREIVHCIEKGGVVPSNSDLYQLTRGVRRALYAWGVDTGSVNSLSVSLDPPLTSYGQGLEIRVLVAHDNTAACTIRVNNLATQQIVKKDGTTLIAGDLREGGIAVLVHDGTNFQLVSGAAGSTTIADGWFNGADYIVDVGTVNHIVGTPAIAPTAYAAGQGFCVLVKNANTGPVDINVNALGIKSLVLPSGEQLGPGDIIPNVLIYIRYDGSKFMMLSRIEQEIIGSAITKIVGPNTGADFSDLNKAFAWLRRRRIAPSGGYVTLQLQGQTGTALVHSYSSAIPVYHPDGDRIAVQGPGMNFIPTPGNFTHTNNFASDAAANVAMLRSAFQAEVRFTAGNLGFNVTGTITVRNLLFTGPSYSPAGQGSVFTVGHGIVHYDTIAAAYGSSCCFSIDVNASLAGRNIYGVGSGLFTFGLAHASNLLSGGASNNFVIAQSLSDGIQAAHGAIIQIDAPSSRPRFYNCNGWGINHWGASSVHMSYSYMRNCVNGGVASTSANSWLYGADISACGRGVTASIGGFIDANTTTIQNNTYGDYIATQGSHIYAAAFQIPSAQFSPARNTFGNGASWIEG